MNNGIRRLSDDELRCRLGGALRTLRGACGLTMRDMATLIGMGVPFVSGLEMGRESISKLELRTWLRAMLTGIEPLVQAEEAAEWKVRECLDRNAGRK